MSTNTTPQWATLSSPLSLTIRQLSRVTCSKAFQEDTESVLRLSKTNTEEQWEQEDTELMISRWTLMEDWEARLTCSRHLEEHLRWRRRKRRTIGQLTTPMTFFLWIESFKEEQIILNHNNGKKGLRHCQEFYFLARLNVSLLLVGTSWSNQEIELIRSVLPANRYQGHLNHLEHKPSPRWKTQTIQTRPLS